METRRGSSQLPLPTLCVVFLLTLHSSDCKLNGNDVATVVDQDLINPINAFEWNSDEIDVIDPNHVDRDLDYLGSYDDSHEERTKKNAQTPVCIQSRCLDLYSGRSVPVLQTNPMSVTVVNVQPQMQQPPGPQFPSSAAAGQRSPLNYRDAGTSNNSPNQAPAAPPSSVIDGDEGRIIFPLNPQKEPVPFKKFVPQLHQVPQPQSQQPPFIPIPQPTPNVPFNYNPQPQYNNPASSADNNPPQYGHTISPGYYPPQRPVEGSLNSYSQYQQIPMNNHPQYFNQYSQPSASYTPTPPPPQPPTSYYQPINQHQSIPSASNVNNGEQQYTPQPPQQYPTPYSPPTYSPSQTQNQQPQSPLNLNPNDHQKYSLHTPQQPNHPAPTSSSDQSQYSPQPPPPPTANQYAQPSSNGKHEQSSNTPSYAPPPSPHPSQPQQYTQPQNQAVPQPNPFYSQNNNPAPSPSFPAQQSNYPPSGHSFHTHVIGSSNPPPQRNYPPTSSHPSDPDSVRAAIIAPSPVKQSPVAPLEPPTTSQPDRGTMDQKSEPEPSATAGAAKGQPNTPRNDTTNNQDPIIASGLGPMNFFQTIQPVDTNEPQQPMRVNIGLPTSLPQQGQQQLLPSDQSGIGGGSSQRYQNPDVGSAGPYYQATAARTWNYPSAPLNYQHPPNCGCGNHDPSPGYQQTPAYQTQNNAVYQPVFLPPAPQYQQIPSPPPPQKYNQNHQVFNAPHEYQPQLANLYLPTQQFYSTIPCPQNLIFNCAPNVQGVACDPGYYGGGLPQYVLPPQLQQLQPQLYSPPQGQIPQYERPNPYREKAPPTKAPADARNNDDNSEAAFQPAEDLINQDERKAQQNREITNMPADSTADENVIPAIVQEVTTPSTTTSTAAAAAISPLALPIQDNNRLLIPGAPFGMGWKPNPAKIDLGGGTGERKSSGLSILDDLREKLNLGGTTGLIQ